MIDRVLSKITPPESPPETDEQKKKRLQLQQEKRDKENEKNKNFSISYFELKEAINKGVVPTVASSDWPQNILVYEEEGKDLLVSYLNRRKTDDKGLSMENKVRHHPIYPLQIEVTIDGISGVLPGHCFLLDNVPKMYKDTGVFQVVEVGHEVNQSDWKTTLRCFFRYTSDSLREIAMSYPVEKEPDGVGGGEGGAG